MSGWRDTTIGGLGRVVTGSTPPSKHPDWFGDDLPFVTPSDITFGNRRPRPERWLSQSGRDGLRTRVVPPGSAAFVCIGATIGKVCLVETEAITNQQINTVIPGPHTDSRFLYSLLRHLAPTVTQGASGAATPIINKSAFSAIPVRTPDLETQVRIGEVLGALDDLIENNRRRVEVLEEMARAIYREWFVKFRYPGHEDVPMVDSALGLIPEGWQVGELNDLVQLIRDTVDPAAIDAETPAVGLEHIPRKQITLDSWGTAGDQGSRKGVFEKGDVLFGKIRPYFHKVSVAPIDGICSTDAIVLRPASEHWGQAVFVLSSGELVAHATATSNGTKMPRADWKVLGRWPVALPPSAIAGQFTEIARDQLEMAEALMFENARLTNLRDLLLPKLVTGKIDVTSLDLDAAGAEQVAE
ncbi:restriction endonuclease subunit S [Corynebacterium sanguinis]|uniref:restriction endonuclease subunit S n=1 Tax=Corynebacterium sanguinis TaxID=2594913 RepID=UPI00264C3655|nr:restriction endonuclease subunit S [Corynebacterium sanguinis]MDN8576790.1 restriction endonuclease subunit S [Corynebacterium sanguinis]